MNKSGGMSDLAVLVLGVLVIVLVLPLSNMVIDQRQYTDNLSQNITPNVAFTPYQHEYTDDQQLAIDSMDALVQAVNGLAEGRDIFYATRHIDVAELPFDEYELIVSGKIELEEDQFNSEFPWTFADKWSLKSKQSEPELKDRLIGREGEKSVFFNYYYDECRGNRDDWIYCPDFQDRGDGDGKNCKCPDNNRDSSDIITWTLNPVERVVSSNLVRDAKAENLAAVAAMNQAYNVELRTYKDGEVICTASTRADGDLSDKAADLKTWGSHREGNCRNERGSDGIYDCDRNANGVWGDYNRMAGQTPPGASSSPMSEEQLKIYFPEDVIREGSHNGEGCLDSPTFLMCDGIKVYYCGKMGFRSGASNPSQEYYYQSSRTGDLRVRAGAKFQTALDPRILISEQYDDPTTGVKRDDRSNEILFGYTGREIFTQLDTYATEFDLDVVFGVALMPVNLWAGISSVSSTLALREYDDPFVVCRNAQPIGKTQIPKIRCSQEDGTCAVCDFNLPQDLEVFEENREAAGPVGYIAGYGDPAYVVYANAFPPGEEEAWQVSEQQISYKFMIGANIAFALFPVAGRAVKAVADLTKILGKVAGKSPKLLGPLYEMPASFVRRGWDFVSFKRSRQFLGDRAAQLKNDMRSALRDWSVNRLGKRLYARIFTSSDNVLKYADDKVLKQINQNANDIAELMVRRGDGVYSQATRQFDDIADQLRRATDPADIARLRNSLMTSQEAMQRNLPSPSRLNLDDATKAQYEALQAQIRQNNEEIARLSVRGTDEQVIQTIQRNNVLTRQAMNLDPSILATQADDVLARTLRNIQSDPELARQFRRNVATNRALPAAFKEGGEFALAYMMAMEASLFDSMNEKFFPIGSNSIGVKKPFVGTFVSGEQFSELSDAVKKYTLLLVKDRFEGGLITEITMNQNLQRFYLASPCTDVNLLIAEGQASCFDYVNGSENLLEQARGPLRDVYGTTSFEKSSLNPEYANTDAERYEMGIKLCPDRSQDLRSLFEAPVHRTDAIFINPVPIEGPKFGTFCYGGSAFHANAAKIGVVIGGLAVSIALQAAADAIIASTLGVGAVVVRPIQVLLEIGVDWVSEEATYAIDSAQKWPNHSLLDQTEMSS